MSFFKYMLTHFVTILSMSFICSTIFCTVFPPDNYSLPVIFLWELIISSILCTASTVVFKSKKELSKKQIRTRYIIHFFIIVAIILATGYLGDWNIFKGNRELLVFILLVTITYFLVIFIINLIDTHSANMINQKLKEFQKKEL